MDIPRKGPLETLAESNARLRKKVAELEREAARARYLAYHDALTGLPNRVLLLDRLKQATSQAARQRKAVGLLLLDLDRFKSVNDELGHNAGDIILQRVAARLLGCIRRCDTASRYGGDEFIVLLPEIRGTEEVETVSDKIHARLSVPHRLGDRAIVVGASIGAAVFKESGATCGEMIAAADAAMYQAKAHVAVYPDEREPLMRRDPRAGSGASRSLRGGADPVR